MFGHFDNKVAKVFAYLSGHFALSAWGTYGHYFLSTHKTWQSWVTSAIGPGVALFIRSRLPVKLRNRNGTTGVHSWLSKFDWVKLPPPSNGTYVTTMEDKSDDDVIS
jgi:hypothetical protein